MPICLFLYEKEIFLILIQISVFLLEISAFTVIKSKDLDNFGKQPREKRDFRRDVHFSKSDCTASVFDRLL